MKKPLEKEFGKHVAEKRGWHWALTGFVMEYWGNGDLKIIRVSNIEWLRV
jgi:hypothetical protein